MRKYFLIYFSVIFVVWLFFFSVVSRISIYHFVWPVFIVYLILFFKPSLSLWSIIFLGVFFDWFSPYFFGFYLMLFLLIYSIGFILIKKYLTDKSLSIFLLISGLLTLVSYFYIYLFDLIFKFFDSNLYYNISWKLILIQLVVNAILSVILYGITLFFTKRLRLDLLKR
jgi:hypothetical protein